MNKVVFIPVRGGSKSIPKKNIKMIHNKPLVYWAVKAAFDCEKVDGVFVCSEDEEIRQVVSNFIEEENLSKVHVIDRTLESARDEASTEEVMLEFAQKYDFEHIILMQATSPMVTVEDIDRAIEMYEQEGVDSVLSAVKQKRFIWMADENGDFCSINYDIYKRPRRQEMDGYWVENGAIYITPKWRLLEYKNRISGNIRISPMGDETYFEIDELKDWDIVEEILKRREN